MSNCDDPLNPIDVEALFPEDVKPEDRLDKVSSLCSYGMRPHVMTGFLRQLLIGHFADPDNIEEARIRRQLEAMGAWKPADNGLSAGGFLIESITRWVPNAADQRPAILIKRNQWDWLRQGIGDRVGDNYLTGKTNYAGFWQGSHTLYCITQKGAETEFLATEVIKYIIGFSPFIRSQMDLHKFFVSSVGGVGEIQEVVQGYAVPVTVTYVAEEAWSLQPYVPRLKRIVFKASDLLGCY